MSDIFKEVDEALKQEKVEEFWKKNGNLIIFVIILIIGGTGAFTFYNNWLNSDREKKTEIVLDLYQKNPEFNEARLSELNPDQKSLAEFFLARDYLEKEEFSEAFSAFEAIRTNTSVDMNLRGLAAYYARNMILNKQVEGDLNSITLDRPSIWDGHLNLQTAVDLGSRQEKYEDAIAMLNLVISRADPSSDSLRQQAEQLKYVYEYDLKKGN